MGQIYIFILYYNRTGNYKLDKEVKFTLTMFNDFTTRYGTEEKKQLTLPLQGVLYFKTS